MGDAPTDHRAAITYGRSIGITVIAGGGTIVGAVALAQSVQPDEPTLGVSLGIMVVLGMTLPSWAVGWWLYQSDYDARRVYRVLAWSLLGGVPLAGLTLVIAAYQTAHGGVIHQLSFIVAIMSGVGLVGGAFTGIHDVERVRRETAFRSMDLRFRTLIDAAPVAIIGVDTDGVVELWNDAASDVFGYQQSAVLGEPVPIRAFHEQDQTAISQSWVTPTDRPREFECERADGTRIVVEGRTASVPGPESATGGYLTIISDVTERNRREQRLGVLHRVLRHNLRTNVTVLQGHADLLEDPEPCAITNDHSVDAIQESTRNLNRLSEKAGVIERTLRDTTDRRVFDLGVLAERHVEDATERHPHAEITIETAGVTWVHAGPGVGTAIDEAIDNAVDHHDGDRPVVEVSVGLDPDGETVSVTIADDGPGIPEAERDPVERGEETQIQHVTGLGLWLMQWALTGSGGVVEFGENDPRGSTVTFSLPATSPEADGPACPVDAPETLSGSDSGESVRA